MSFLIGLLLIKVILVAADNVCDFKTGKFCPDWNFNGDWQIEDSDNHPAILPKDSTRKKNYFAETPVYARDSVSVSSPYQSYGSRCIFFNLYVSAPKGDIDLNVLVTRWLSSNIKQVKYLNNTWTSMYFDYEMAFSNAGSYFEIELKSQIDALVAVDDLAILESSCKKGFNDGKIKLLLPVVATTTKPTTARPTTVTTTTVTPKITEQTTIVTPKITEQTTIVTPKITEQTTIVTPKITEQTTIVTPKITEQTTIVTPKITEQTTTVTPKITESITTTIQSTHTSPSQALVTNTTSSKELEKETTTNEATSANLTTTPNTKHYQSTSTNSMPSEIHSTSSEKSTIEIITTPKLITQNTTLKDETTTTSIGTSTENDNIGIKTESTEGSNVTGSSNITEGGEITKQTTETDEKSKTTSDYDYSNENGTEITPDYDDENTTNQFEFVTVKEAKPTDEIRNEVKDDNLKGDNKLDAKYWVLICGAIVIVLIGTIALAMHVIKKKRLFNDHPYFFTDYENTSNDSRDQSNPTYSDLEATNNFTFDHADGKPLTRHDTNQRYVN